MQNHSSQKTSYFNLSRVTVTLRSMSSLAGKHVLVGVTGGIAAYKSAELVRRLVDQEASVRVVMTQAAREFITPLTLQAVSGHPVRDALLDSQAEAGMGHIELARWAAHVIIAPATAAFSARLAAGRAHGEPREAIVT